MGTTSQSTKGCWIEPLESLSPIPNAESEIEDRAG